VQEKPLYGFKCREIQTKSQLKRFSNTDSRNMQIQQSRIFRVISNKYAISQRSKTHIRDRKHFEKIFLGPKLGYNSPQQQAPNQQMTSITSPKHVITPASKHIIPEYIVPGQILTPSIPKTISESYFMITSDAPDVEVEQSSFTVIKKSVPDKPSSSTQTPTSTNSQSSSSLAIQPVAPTKPTKISSPPTIFLDSTLLQDVCENISQELIKMIQARNNLTHKESYEKQWRRLKDRVDFVLSELQRTCLDEQDSAQ
jgi:hypothetical protein